MGAQATAQKGRGNREQAGGSGGGQEVPVVAAGSSGGQEVPVVGREIPQGRRAGLASRPRSYFQLRGNLNPSLLLSRVNKLC